MASSSQSRTSRLQFDLTDSSACPKSKLSEVVRAPTVDAATDWSSTLRPASFRAAPWHYRRSSWETGLGCSPQSVCLIRALPSSSALIILLALQWIRARGWSRLRWPSSASGQPMRSRGTAIAPLPYRTLMQRGGWHHGLGETGCHIINEARNDYSRRRFRAGLEGRDVDSDCRVGIFYR